MSHDIFLHDPDADTAPSKPGRITRNVVDEWETTDADAYTRPDWHDDAACKAAGPNLFYPDRGEDVRKAKAICAACPVRQQCLDYSIETRQTYGVWGGLSERQRRALRRDRRLNNPDVNPHTGIPRPACGTPGGWHGHQYRKEPSCRACLDAHNAYNRSRRNGAA